MEVQDGEMFDFIEDLEEAILSSNEDRNFVPTVAVDEEEEIEVKLVNGEIVILDMETARILFNILERMSVAKKILWKTMLENKVSFNQGITNLINIKGGTSEFMRDKMFNYVLDLSNHQGVFEEE